MKQYPEVLHVLQQSGLFVDKTFLAIFGSWKHKTTGEPMQYATRYLNCDVNEAIALFEARKFDQLLTHVSDQTHLHFDARYTDSGAVVGLQLIYSGPPDFGACITETFVATDAKGKALLPVVQKLKG